MKHLPFAQLALIALCSVAVGGPPSAGAEIYRWVNANGVLSFGNTHPVGKRMREVEQLEETGGPGVGESTEPPVLETSASEVEPPAEAERIAGVEGEPAATALGEGAEGEGGEVEDSAMDEPRIVLSVTHVPVYFSETFGEEASGENQVLLTKAYLSESLLREVDLAESDFGGANMVASNVQDAIFDGGNFQGAFLVNSNLGGVSAQDADLRNARLQGANLRNVDFRGCDLRGAIFGGANLEGANLDEAELSGADLRGAYGVTPEQLARAYIDKETQFPEFFASPIYLTGSAPIGMLSLGSVGFRGP